MLEIWNSLITAKEDYRARAIPRDRGTILDRKTYENIIILNVCVSTNNFIAHEVKMDEM